MTAFVAVVARDPARGVPELPAACVAALQLAGTSLPELYAAPGFSCGVARAPSTRGGLLVVDGHAVVGDVRLDRRCDTARAVGLDSLGDSDLPIVAALLRRDVSAGVSALHGDFSFVIWDAGARTARAIRDGLGVRPLYYAETGDAVVFGNVIKAVRAHPGVRDALHAPALVSFLTTGFNVDLGTTTFSDIRRLAPGTFATVASGRHGPVVTQHWRMPDPEPLELRRPEEYVARYRALLADAVSDRLPRERSLLLLSGGIDSPSIVAAAAATGGPPVGERLEGLTFRATDVETDDEVRLAGLVADRFGLRHHVVASPTDARPEALPQTPEPLDEPEFPAIAAMLRRHAPPSGVVIQGEDGDALFSPPGLASMLRREDPWQLARRFAGYVVSERRLPHLGTYLRRRLRNVFRRSPDGGRRADVGGAAARWLSPRALRVGAPTESAPSPHRARPEATRSLSASTWQSVHDGTSRAFHGAPVEYRWPLLDSRLLEFVFSIPAIPWCQRKLLPRRAFATELPGEVLARRKTTVPAYFATAVAAWRRRTGAKLPALHPVVAELIELPALRRVLADGTHDEVLAAWRAIELSRWLDGDTAP